ncbi:MAG TPA: hypothetical protein PKJ64_15340, partial [bacterium]|nr:hypothetical protein [bacterium]
LEQDKKIIFNQNPELEILIEQNPVNLEENSSINYKNTHFLIYVFIIKFHVGPFTTTYPNLFIDENTTYCTVPVR